MTLDSLKQRWEKATPGPWRRPLGTTDVRGPNGENVTYIHSHQQQHQDDADAIAHAPTDIAALLAVAEVATRVCDEVYDTYLGDLRAALDALEALP